MRELANGRHYFTNSADAWSILCCRTSRAMSPLSTTDACSTVSCGCRRSDARWSDLGGRYGPSTTRYNRCNHCSKKGISDRLAHDRVEAYDSDIQMFDSSSVPIHPYVAGSKRGQDGGIGRSRSERMTKIHTFVEAIRLPLRVALTRRQARDSVLV